MSKVDQIAQDIYVTAISQGTGLADVSDDELQDLLNACAEMCYKSAEAFVKYQDKRRYSDAEDS